MNEIGSRIIKELRARKCEGRIVSVKHLAELKSEIEETRRAGQFCEEFYRERLSYFVFEPPENLRDARVLIIVAVPQPQILVTFTWEGRPRPFVVPPTYDSSVNNSIRGMLREVLEPAGYHVAPSALPLKLLAVRSGLAVYGKNNISYIPGMGSFYRLMAFYSDLPCVEDTWGPSMMLERCAHCTACLKLCPTGAIESNRFLLRAERCLTFHNESSKDFPEWIRANYHHCIVGCMRCQTICPENKPIEHWVEAGAFFSQEETALITQHPPPAELPERVRSELEKVGLIEYLELLPRNLGVLTERDSCLSARTLPRENKSVVE